MTIFIFILKQTEIHLAIEQMEICYLDQNPLYSKENDNKVIQVFAWRNIGGGNCAKKHVSF